MSSWDVTIYNLRTSEKYAREMDKTPDRKRIARLVHNALDTPRTTCLVSCSPCPSKNRELNYICTIGSGIVRVAKIGTNAAYVLKDLE